MTQPHLRAKRSANSTDRVGEARLTAIVVLATVIALATLSVVAMTRDGGADASDPSPTTAGGLSGVAALAAPAAQTTQESLPDLVGKEQRRKRVCPVEPESLRQGDTGDDVICLQRALVKAGALEAEPSGTFDGATFQAVRRIQEERDLFVDGVVGRASEH